MTKEELLATQVKWPYVTDRNSQQLKEEDVVSIREYAEELFEMSANLTETQKVLVNMFDNKIRSLGFLTTDIPSIEFSEEEIMEDETIQLIGEAGQALALYDSTVLAWKEKLRHDAVRPTSIIKELFQNQKVFAWGGDSKGTTEIQAEEFTSYIRTMPHSEFPSASACICEAVVQFWKEYVGKDELNKPLSQIFVKGLAVNLENLPTKNTVVLYRSLSEYSRICRESRLWGGFHFRPAVEEGQKLCKQVGTNAYNTIMAKTRSS
eukprot:TRINITY_DN1987_c0_g1_i4.p1 TRINITY_DN1987_c0_g1~~TRINITY_DN1987_c0_g1_i4.p1  ORF type:complete len:275 (-),score=38.53 TRINITY_DN1987_c0_g1_i4:786-1577(-)